MRPKECLSRVISAPFLGLDRVRKANILREVDALLRPDRVA